MGELLFLISGTNKTYSKVFKLKVKYFKTRVTFTAVKSRQENKY